MPELRHSQPASMPAPRDSFYTRRGKRLLDVMTAGGSCRIGEQTTAPRQEAAREPVRPHPRPGSSDRCGARSPPAYWGSVDRGRSKSPSSAAHSPGTGPPGRFRRGLKSSTTTGTHR